MRGKSWLEATFWTKPESWTIEFSLLVVESVERLSEDSVRDGFCEARGSRRDEVEVGKEERSAIVQYLLIDECWSCMGQPQA